MQERNQSFIDAASTETACAFCQSHKITDILHVTPHFLLVADHAPLVEGHLLIIPKQHYACYGNVPACLDEELFAIKEELRQFYLQYYSPVVFWEHGVFRQTVFHAHLHCFPWGQLEYDLTSQVHNAVVTTQEDIRSWFRRTGHYFYLEDDQIALLFAPEIDRYTHVVQKVFQKHRVGRMRNALERYMEGKPLIEGVVTRWQAFQAQRSLTLQPEPDRTE